MNCGSAQGWKTLHGGLGTLGSSRGGEWWGLWSRDGVTWVRVIPLSILNALLSAQMQIIPFLCEPPAWIQTALCLLKRQRTLCWSLGTEGHLGQTDRVAAGHLLGKRVEKNQQRDLVSSRSLGGFARGLIRLGGSPERWARFALPWPAAPPRAGRCSCGSVDKTCMRTCTEIDGCAYELMIAGRIDAACPTHAVLLPHTSSGSAGRASGCCCSTSASQFIWVFRVFILRLLPELLGAESG